MPRQGDRSQINSRWFARNVTLWHLNKWEKQEEEEREERHTRSKGHLQQSVIDTAFSTPATCPAHNSAHDGAANHVRIVDLGTGTFYASKTVPSCHEHAIPLGLRNQLRVSNLEAQIAAGSVGCVTAPVRNTGEIITSSDSHAHKQAICAVPEFGYTLTNICMLVIYLL